MLALVLAVSLLAVPVGPAEASRHVATGQPWTSDAYPVRHSELGMVLFGSPVADLIGVIQYPAAAGAGNEAMMKLHLYNDVSALKKLISEVPTNPVLKLKTIQVRYESAGKWTHEIRFTGAYPVHVAQSQELYKGKHLYMVTIKFDKKTDLPLKPY